MALGAILWLEPKEHTFHSASAATENGTVLDLGGKYGSLAVQVVGSTWTGTITFKVSVDGTNYVAIEGVNINDGSKASTTTGNGIFLFNVSGVTKFMADHARTAGSVTVKGVAQAIPPGNLADVQLTASSVTVTQATHDNLNANANMQVADTDVGNANPVPVSDAGGSLTVDGTVTATQTTHDNLNLNANVQVGNADVGNANPVPVSDAGTTLSVDDGAGSLTVDGTVTAAQTTHDNLNLNANLQVANADVGNANPVPVSDAGTTLSVDDGAGSLTVDSAQLPSDLTASGNLKAALVESTATVNVQVTGSNVEGAEGVAPPSKALLIGGSESGVLRALRIVNGPVDGAAGTYAPVMAARQQTYNGTNWDNARGNTESSLLTSAARTTTAESAVQTLHNHKGVTANIDVTAKAGATTLTINLLMKDANGDYQVFSSSAALAAAAGTTYSVTFYPGVTSADFATNHSGKSVPVPRSYKIQFVPSDADSVTYSASQAQEL